MPHIPGKTWIGPKDDPTIDMLAFCMSNYGRRVLFFHRDHREWPHPQSPRAGFISGQTEIPDRVHLSVLAHPYHDLYLDAGETVRAVLSVLVVEPGKPVPETEQCWCWVIGD